MICMPGVTFVDFSAMSVSRLISMPGEISTYRDASPGRGRNPCATVPRNAAYCGWRLSRKQYARSSMPFVTLPSRSSSCRHVVEVAGPSRRPSGAGALRVQDLHAGRRPDAGGAGRDHVPDVLDRPDPPRRLHPEAGSHRLAHEQHVVDGRAARPVAGRGLHVVGPGLLGQVGGQHLLLVGEDRKSTRLNSSHVKISYAVFCLKKKKIDELMLVFRKKYKYKIERCLKTVRV